MIGHVSRSLTAGILPMLYCLSGIPAHAQGAGPQENPRPAHIHGVQIDPNLDKGTIAIIDGAAVDELDFMRWLADSKGRYYLNEYIDRILILRAAEENGVVISEGDLDAAFQREWNRNVLYRFRGNEGAYLEELNRTGRSFEDHREERLAEIRIDLMTQELVRSERNPGDEELRRLYEEEFGQEGVQNRIRVAFFDKLGVQAPGAPRPSRDQFVQLAEDAKTRANTFLNAVQSQTMSFEEACKEFSDDLRVPTAADPLFNYRDIGGEIENCKRQMFGREVDGALKKMVEDGELSPVIDSHRGFYVVQLVSRKDVSYEEKEGELLVKFLEKAPHAGEIFKLKERLRKAASIVKKY